jgi:hypothetical protein
VTDVERALRETLSRHAGEAPGGAQLLSRVRAESGRRRVRRRATLAGGLAVLAVATATTAWRLAEAQPAPAGLSVGGPLGSPTPAHPSPSATAVRFGPGSLAVTFPYRPTVAINGLDRPTVELVSGEPTLSYPPVPATVPGVTVTISSQQPAQPGSALPVSGAPGVVRGHPVRFLLLDEDGVKQVSMSWPERPDQWIEVRAPATVPVPALVSYAAGLVAEPQTVAWPFTFDVIPLDLTVDNVTPGAVTFRPAWVAPDAAFVNKLTVSLADTSSGLFGRQVSIGGQPGWLSTGPGATTIQVEQGQHKVVEVQVWNTIAASTDDLLRFAAGIRPTAAAQTAKG